MTLGVVLFGVFAAAILRGFTGFGFGLAAVPLLSIALPPSQVVPFVVVLQVVVGLGGLRGAWKSCDWRSIGLLTPGLVLGIPVGISILSLFAANPVRLAIGFVIAASVALLWFGVRLPPRPSRWIAGGVGLLSGVISGLALWCGPLLARRRGFVILILHFDLVLQRLLKRASHRPHI